MGKWAKIGIIVCMIILFFFLISILPTNSPKTQEKSLEQQTADATIKTISSEKVTSNQKVLNEKPTTLPEQNSEVQVNIKDALEIWSNDLPTEYRLSDIQVYCNKNQLASLSCINPSTIGANAEQIEAAEAIARAEGKPVPTKAVDDNSKICEKLEPVKCSDIEESYTRAIGSSSFDSGRGSVYRFKTKEIAKQQYDISVNKIKDERGYTLITTPDNCFGWKKDLMIVTQLQIICYKLNVIYLVGFTDDEKITEYSKQLGELLT